MMSSHSHGGFPNDSFKKSKSNKVSLHGVSDHPIHHSRSHSVKKIPESTLKKMDVSLDDSIPNSPPAAETLECKVVTKYDNETILVSTHIHGKVYSGVLFPISS
eukprot:Sdes_comp18502_c0_seq1m8525